MNTNRIMAVLEKMKMRGLSQILICDILSIYYLTGIYIQPGERFYALYLSKNGDYKLFVNNLFSAPEVAGINIVWYNDAQPVIDIAAKYVDCAKILGVDKHLPAKFLLPLIEKKAAAGFELASICVDECRGLKDGREQSLMREASLINDQAMGEFKKLIVPGITEKGLAEQMLRLYEGLGADCYSFSPIVAFGENAADAHHEPGNTCLNEGDCVLIDTGCMKDMYCSDMTRTFFYRQVSVEHQSIYHTVKKANEAAIAMIKPGIQLKQIDKAARDIISAAGYGPYFTHRLGHFIGLEAHEFGDVSASNEEIALPGMIFSIEPGIYLQGNVGVRIEDLVLVTEDGCVLLNHYSKELEIIE